MADYPFTTIAPVLGTVEAPDGRQLTVADVPGLLEGASEGIGLGDEFLAHLERARLFLHVDRRARRRGGALPGDRQRAGAAYGAGLAERPQIVVLNKIDLVAEPPDFELDDPRILGVVAVSAVTGEGIDRLKAMVFTLVPESAPAPVEDRELADYLVYRPRPPRHRRFRIFRTPGGYRVRGEASEDELRAAGIKPDAVVEFEDA